jgi:PAS domain S-box-containing protein
MRDRYVDLYEFAPVGYFTLTRNGMIAEVNLTGAALLGVARKKLLNRSFTKFVIPEDSDQWNQHFMNLLQRDGRQHCELTILRGDGSRTQVSVASLKSGDSLSSIEIDDPLCANDKSNNSRMFRIVVTDITQRIAGEVLLSAIEEKYRILYESMDEGYCVVDMIFDPTGKPVDYRYIEVNPAFEKNTGLQHALGKTIREMDDSHWFEIYGQVARTGEAIRFENVAIAMSRYYDVYAFRIGDNNSNKVGILFRDITEHRSAEELVKKNEANLQAMLDNSPYLTWLKDSSGRYIKINKLFADYLRLEGAEQAVGKTDFDLQPIELAEKYLADDLEVTVTREQKHVEERAFDENKYQGFRPVGLYARTVG